MQVSSRPGLGPGALRIPTMDWQKGDEDRQGGTLSLLSAVCLNGPRSRAQMLTVYEEGFELGGCSREKVFRTVRATTPLHESNVSGLHSHFSMWWLEVLEKEVMI